MTRDELLKKAGTFGTDDGLTITFTADSLLAFLSSEGVTPTDTRYFARRWCTGDNGWTDWQTISAVDYERRRLDPSFQLQVVHAGQPAPVNA